MVDLADAGFRPGSSMRPIDWRTYRRIARTPWVLYLLSGLTPLPILLTPGARAQLPHLALAVTGAIVTVVIGLIVFVGVELAPQYVYRRPAPYALASVFAATGLTTLALVSFGPHFGVIALTYPEPVIFTVMLFRPLFGIVSIALVALGSSAVYALQDGWSGAVGQWTIVLGATIGLAVFAGDLAARLIAAGAAEHAARSELAEVNTSLQQRVQEQVTELERAGQLRRFLAPQVADAVLSGDEDDLLRPHRRRIAAFFCDLRGFTAFAAGVEPEEVIEVLDTYYRVVGRRLRERDATVGGFAGDGIVAYFNDPVPCDDPAGTAVAMAREIRDDLSAEVRRWRRTGYDLGFGIGIAVGHATLGVVGFEGRQDYTAIGTVMNLAARLCAAAGSGQILIDPRAAGDLDGTLDSEVVRGLELKGFPAETEVHAVR